MFFRRFKERNGFTLIEMINVIVIIGILALIAIPKFINLRKDATAARDQAVLAALRSAVYLYYVQSATQGGEPVYPPDIDTLKSMIIWNPPDLADQYTWVEVP